MDSPCIKVCTLAPDGSHCTGCYRTPSEISGWVAMSDRQRAEIMDRCLSSPWGTKCTDCVDYRKHQQEEEMQNFLDNAERGLF